MEHFKQEHEEKIRSAVRVNTVLWRMVQLRTETNIYKYYRLLKRVDQDTIARIFYLISIHHDAGFFGGLTKRQKKLLKHMYRQGGILNIAG